MESSESRRDKSNSSNIAMEKGSAITPKSSSESKPEQKKHRSRNNRKGSREAKAGRGYVSIPTKGDKAQEMARDAEYRLMPLKLYICGSYFDTI